ncbi:MAG: acyltransferase [Rhodanobacter sp.]|nr:MAG: acyltransferase [Rhodanobacter sp.]
MNGRLPSPDTLPPHMPHLRDGLRRRTCRAILKLCGWGLSGEFPDVPQLVVIVAPHSSWWDGIWGLLIKVGIGADVHFMGKQELFRGPLGRLLIKLGGIPINRGAAKGVVEQMIEQFQQHDQLWLGIAPEGTRKPVKHWKSGFLRIAHAANVPIMPVLFDYPSKTFILEAPVHTTGDFNADMARIRALFRPAHGKHRNTE